MSLIVTYILPRRSMWDHQWCIVVNSKLSFLFDDCAYVCWYVSISGHHHQCRASSNGYQHGSHSGASATSSNYHSYQQQQSYAKQQEEYARKLYTLRYALKSDVFMGYGKSKCETALLLANSSFSWANLCAWILLSSLFFDLILFLVHILLFKNTHRSTYAQIETTNSFG